MFVRLTGPVVLPPCLSLSLLSRRFRLRFLSVANLFCEACRWPFKSSSVFTTDSVTVCNRSVV